jgi:hypothetical protein
MTHNTFHDLETRSPVPIKNGTHAYAEKAEVLPCGKSAHLELGGACGRGKRTIVLMAEPDTPELMYLESMWILGSVQELVDELRDL